MAFHQLFTGALNWYRAMPLDFWRTVTLGKVTVPTLYVVGDSDAFVAGDSAARTRDWVTGIYEEVIIPGMDHWLPEKAFEQVAAAFVSHARALTLK